MKFLLILHPYTFAQKIRSKIRIKYFRLSYSPLLWSSRFRSTQPFALPAEISRHQFWSTSRRPSLFHLLIRHVRASRNRVFAATGPDTPCTSVFIKGRLIYLAVRSTHP